MARLVSFSKTSLLVSLFSVLSPLSGSAQSVPVRFQGKALSTSTIELKWAGVEDSFQILRTSDGLTYDNLSTVTGSARNFTDQGLSASAPYLYKICSIKNGVKSKYTSVVGVATKALTPLTDLTDDVAKVLTVQVENTTNASENSQKVVDNDYSTKYLFYASSGWMTCYYPNGAVLTQYLLASANDAPERDPKEWKLEGSNDNATWTLLDTRVAQKFAGRYTKLHYSIENTLNFKYYRLTIQKNNGGSLTQLSELQLFADCTITRNTTVPKTPSGFTFLAERSVNNLEQIMPSSNQIILTWADLSTNEDNYVLERSTDQQNWDWSVTLPKNTTRYRSVELKPLTTYYYRLKAVNDLGASSFVTTSAKTITDVPPQTIVEDWDVHTQTLYLQYYDDEVAIYYDKDVDTKITWPRTVFTGIWKYLKSVYGNYSDPRLYVYFHAGKYSGGHPSTWSRADHHYRNILDLGTDATTATAWQSFGGNNLDLPVHEIGHIMEGASLYVNGSPERVIWGDSKYAEIFNYDVYTHNNLSDQATRWYNMQMDNSDSTTPTTGIYWFRDWYYPIYSKYGGNKLLADFFVQMAKYLPQKNGDYSRDMNWGEFIHFYSIAAGVNLKDQAKTAFGWKDEWELQFVKAQADFPSDYPMPPFNIMDDGTSEVNFENANTSLNSAKLFDGNLSTSFETTRTASTTPINILVKGSVATTLLNYSLTSGDNTLKTSQYDPAEWNLYGTQNGIDWVLLDSQSSQMFGTRKETKLFNVSENIPYYNYKLEITKLRNDSQNKFSLAELVFQGVQADLEIVAVKPALQDQKINSDLLLNSLNDYPSNNLKVFGLDGRCLYDKSTNSNEWLSLKTGFILPKGLYIYALTLSPGEAPVCGKVMIK